MNDKRIVLDEENFKTLVQKGKVTVDGVKINLDEMYFSCTFNKLISGKVVQQFGAEMILSDIGLDKINKILEDEE